MFHIAAGKAAVVATAAVLAAAGVAGTSAEGDCPAGQEKTMLGCGRVTSDPRAPGSGDGVSSVTPAGGVTFRDENGDRTDSGLSPRDRFQYAAVRRQGKNGDGTLILVHQLTRGVGGWGPLYLAWIPIKYAGDPGKLA